MEYVFTLCYHKHDLSHMKIVNSTLYRLKKWFVSNLLRLYFSASGGPNEAGIGVWLLLIANARSWFIIEAHPC